MNVNLRSSPCDAQQLEAFLRGDLSEPAEREFTLHLSACESCRRALQQQAAEPEAWREAERLLRPGEFDSPLAGASADAAFPLDQRARPPHLIQSVLDALGPTDDPAMLGRLAGYEVSGVVGAGGMGVVLKAIDKSLDRTVAIKVLAPHLAMSGAARRRFAREAKAAAAVLHPNVIAIHSVSNEEELPYLVMPYLRGTSLQKRLDEQGPLPVPEILRIGSQIAAGLDAAHAQGLVHRDIKPANILLEEGVERVAITDFGLARAVDDATLTTSGVIAGTPQYMSPEQARGEAVDQRSDLFSLGSVLYAACTGRPPFRAETSHGVLRRITDDEPAAIREINPEIPQWLAGIIDRLMAKRAADRFATAGEVADLLEKCLAHVQQPEKAPLPAGLPQASLRPVGRRMRLTILGVLAMIAAVGMGLLGIALLSADPPDIAGEWTGQEWGQVVLKKTEGDKYAGTYTDTFGQQPGEIELKWSRVERRFNGTWREGADRFGKISVRLVGEEIRGAHTTDRKSKISPGVPRLADLAWRRADYQAEPPKTAAAAKPAFGPVREGMLPYGIPCEQQYFQFANGKVFVVGHGPATSKEEFAADRKKMDDAGGADISIGSNVGIQLVGEGCIFTQDFFNLHWDTFTAEQVVSAMKRVNFSFGVVEPAKKDLPVTYLFKTSRGEVGILELLALVDDGNGLHALGNGLRFRYKLVQVEAKAPTEPRPIGSNPATAGAGEESNGPSQPKSKLQGVINDLIDQELVAISLGSDDGLRIKDTLTVNRDNVYLGKVTVIRVLANKAIARIEARQGEIRRGDQVFTAARQVAGGAEFAAPPAADSAAQPAASSPTQPAANSPAQPAATSTKPERVRQFQIADRASTVAYSADGKLIALAHESAARILDAATGDVKLSLKLTTAEEDAVLAATEHMNHSQVAGLAFSAAGDVLAVGTSIGQVKLYNPLTGDLIRTIDDPESRLADKETPANWKPMARAIGSVHSLALSPDGSRLAVCGDSFRDFSDVFDGIESLGLPVTGPGRLKVFDAKTGKLLHELSGHSDARAVAISADGEWLASTGRWHDGTNHGSGVIVWNLQSGEKKTMLVKESNGGTPAVAFSPTRKMIAFAALQFDNENDTRSTAVSVAFPLTGLTQWQQTIPGWAAPKAFSPDGKSLLVLCEGQSIRIYSVETGELQHEIKPEAEGTRWTDFAVAPAAPHLVIIGTASDQKGVVELWTLPASPDRSQSRAQGR
jgi:serine/threonine-protein kinase